MIRLHLFSGQVVVVFLLQLLLVSAALAESLEIDDFSSDLTRWRHERFNGENDYRLVVEADGNQVLHVLSQQSASALIRNVEFNPVDYPILRWRWKIAHPVATGDARLKAKDDYAARIYVVFPHWIKPLSRTINYIWANRLQIDQFVPSPYFHRSVMLAVESGPERAGEWVDEKRDLVADFRRIFGEEPWDVGAIAIMTDTDNTGESAQAWYDDLILEKRD